MNGSKENMGHLILVVGNSGSGKDSIIKGIIEKNADLRIYSPRRYITRRPTEDEENIYINEEEFKKKRMNDEFALEWKIYGLCYGIPIEIEDWLKKGYFVIVNVSRTIIDKAKNKYSNCKVIFIDVPFEITLKRLKERGREKEKGLKERLERAKKNQNYTKADFIINNSGSLKSAVNQFYFYLKKLSREYK